jgi:hypothetical protein
MTELALFVSTFVVVFALGFQSLNVNGGHYWLAFFTSFAISGSNLVLFKLAPSASFAQCVAFMAGGPFGIVASMWAHRRLVGRRRREDVPDPWEEVLRVRLDGVSEVTVGHILQNHLNVHAARMSVNDARRVQRILEASGWTRSHNASGWIWRRTQQAPSQRSPRQPEGSGA